MTNAIGNRVARLEQRSGAGQPQYKRGFRCVVRKGFEAEDRAAAFARLGITPNDDEDLVIMLVSVAPATSDRSQPGFVPQAWAGFDMRAA